MLAEDAAAAQLALPMAESKGAQALDLINQIEQSPGLSAMVGVKNPFYGAIPFTEQAVSGSPAADFKAKLEQLGGQNFLTAFQSLKGGGAITETEGQKATVAIARMQTSQSEEEFLKALHELKGIVVKGVERQKQRAGMGKNYP